MNRTSSQLVELLIALFVAFLAILGGALCIIFLLEEPLRDPNGLEDTRALPRFEDCDLSFEEVTLEAGCSLVEGGGTSFTRAFCNGSSCTTSTDTPDICNNPREACCCRAVGTEDIGIICNDDVTIDPNLRTNATVCGCTLCDDILITIRVFVFTDAGDTPEAIAAAQVFDDDSDELLGVTFNNGFFDFQRPLSVGTVAVRVQAAGFLESMRITRTLMADMNPVVVEVALAVLIVIPIGLGSSALSLRVGQIAAVSAPPNAFTTAGGVSYDDVVVFSGMISVPGDGDSVAALPEGPFVTDNNETFGAILFLVTRFLDVDNEQLQTDSLSIVVAILNDGNLGSGDLFIVYYNATLGTWIRGNDLIPLNEDGRRKRQAGGTEFVTAPGLPVDVFVGVAANLDINCWLQARTFANNFVPLSGTFITLEQRSEISGNEFLYRFGTDTGTGQTTFNELVNNALCLPLACGNFTVATLEARLVSDGRDLQPIDFAPNVFDVGENPPIAIAEIFSIQEVVTTTAAGEPRPFYDDETMCINIGRQLEADIATENYFSFNQTDPDPDVPPGADLCFIKIQIRDCFDDNVVTISTFNPDLGQSGESTGPFQFVVNDTSEDMMIDPGSGDMMPEPDSFCNASIATIRAACIPFRCEAIVTVTVAQNAESGLSGFCDLTSIAVNLNSPILTGSSLDEQLLVDTAPLRSDDYNSPDIGLYTDLTSAGPAEQRCFAGSEMTGATEIDINTGYAAMFTCFET